MVGENENEKKLPEDIEKIIRQYSESRKYVYEKLLTDTERTKRYGDFCTKIIKPERRERIYNFDPRYLENNIFLTRQTIIECTCVKCGYKTDHTGGGYPLCTSCFHKWDYNKALFWKWDTKDDWTEFKNASKNKKSVCYCMIDSDDEC